MSRNTLIWIGLVVIVVTGCVFYGTFGYFRVCTTCGEIERVSEFQIPLQGTTYWRHATVEQTPLSRIVRADGLATGHAHAWIFGAGGGNGVMCAIGEGRHIYDSVKSNAVANFIHCVAVYQGRDEARIWLKLALDPTAYNPLRPGLLVEEYPEQGFADEATFKAWWVSHRDVLMQFQAKSE